jgi:uncharacterized protein YggE
MKVFSMVAALLVTSAIPAHVFAQQLTSNTPTGITVVASGTANVNDWVEEFGLRYTPVIDTGKTAYGACASAVEKLHRSMREMGLGDAVVKTAIEYTSSMPGSAAGPTALAGIRVATENVDRVVSALSKEGWKGPVGATLVPRDEQAATDSAYAAALADARRRASAIAASDGRRIGRLLNVMPLPVDYFSSVLGSLASMATAMGHFTQTATLPEIKQSAIFTFELLP